MTKNSTKSLFLEKQKAVIEKELKRYINKYCVAGNPVTQAVKYSVFTGGKRIRPILTLECASLCGGSVKYALPAACAMEFIHSFSLIHDDLPSMDDDDTRRGMPTCHKKYGEGMAVLAGDALFNLAFQVLAEIGNPKILPEILKLITLSSGISGMIGGQAYDIKYAGKKKSRSLAKKINMLKTGGLFNAAIISGALSAEASAVKIRSLKKFAALFGEAFQLKDDLDDGEHKGRSFIKRSKELTDTVEKAKSVLDIFGKEAHNLKYICCLLLNT